MVVVSSDGQFLRKIKTDSVTRYPNGIDISDAGDILVGDSHGNQVILHCYVVLLVKSTTKC